MKKLGVKIILFFGISFLALACCKEEEACIENIKEDCACVQVYEPVCGCNGKTYSNDCVAVCSGITDYTPGACE